MTSATRFRSSFIEPAMKNSTLARLLSFVPISLALAGAASSAQAQEPVVTTLPPAISTYATRGLTEIEGGLTVNYVHQGDVSSTIVGINPAVRYFVMDGLAVGMALQIQIIEDGPDTYGFLPQAEYNVNMGRLFPYAGVGIGVQYATGDGDSSTNFIINPGVGVKLTFGGGLIGLGIAIPIAFADPTRVGVDVLTRYAIYF